ncbi:hypothetical protein VTJ04DRAFT_3171 [Mycothermus thermophilus]|uniref:uncharacterized protein n=1 Tax=Humicola insolens TaxID=85995 RepID=UPI00374297C7
MPRPTQLPTPASSTDIKGHEGPSMGSIELAFELPPPALPGSTSDNDMARPRRKSSSAANTLKDAFELPPPPTRSRKIIQMKPREETRPVTPVAGPRGSTATTSTSSSGSKRKHNSGPTSAAGKKAARKTAHSLIERRRRSKMNEEFAVLKSMIPACTGEMHKLAILQASIEYIKYLEDCVEKLKAQCAAGAVAEKVDTDVSGHATTTSAMSTHSPTDMPMDAPEGVTFGLPSPAFLPAFTDQTQAPSASSPAILPNDTSSRHYSFSSAAGTEYHSAPTPTTGAAAAAAAAAGGGGGGGGGEMNTYYTTSASTSPYFGSSALGSAEALANALLPPHHHPLPAFGSALTSPALAPRTDAGDQEATAALLMLNQTDRRTTARSRNNTSAGMAAATAGPQPPPPPPRGISVKDLLSTY